MYLLSIKYEEALGFVQFLSFLKAINTIPACVDPMCGSGWQNMPFSWLFYHTTRCCLKGKHNTHPRYKIHPTQLFFASNILFCDQIVGISVLI